MFVLTEIVLQRAIKDGIRAIQNDISIVDEIFVQMLHPKLNYLYGQKYVDGIKTWLESEKIRVIQPWSFDTTKVPAITIHLGSEVDDENKASIGDFYGIDDGTEILVNPMTVSLDIGIHADKSKDYVLWLYYMVNYILYKEKRNFRDLGLQLVTFNASDYNKESKYMAENIWTRWIRFRCTVQNYVGGDNGILIEDIDSDVYVSRQNDNNPIYIP